MRVGILTIQSNVNLGNRLQNYALQTTLEQMGIQCETIKRNKKGYYFTIKAYIRDIIKKDRKSKIREFNKKINWSKYIASKDEVSHELETEYDAIIIGSDQIWNPFFPFSSDSDYLPGIHINKIAYAASFGVDHFDDLELKAHIADLLKGINSISVREEAGVKLVSQLINRDCQLVLDPTLLIDSEQWRAIEKQPSFALPDCYILKYILGDSTSYINKMADQHNYAIIDMNDKMLPIGPQEFIYLIDHAKIICTDSFHASVFSLLLEKSFVIFDRKSDDEDMSSRLDSFCNLFNKWDHRYDSKMFDLTQVQNVDYANNFKTIKELKGVSLEYLKKALFC